MSRVLQVGPLKPSLADTLRNEYDALVLPEGAEREPFLAGPGLDVKVAVTSGRTGVPGRLMESLPALRAVVNFGVGYDTTDVVVARERGILVSNTPDVLTDCVADTALGLTLDVMRGLTTADRFVRRGSWPEGPFPLMRKVSGARVGILGLGRIGRAVATRFEAFGCEIRYHSRREAAGTTYHRTASAVELAAWADVLVLCTSGGDDTRGLVDREVLEALGPRGFLVNVARGSVVDEQALTEMLVAGRLAGAGLDVFADEPHVPSALLELDNVVVLPHVASGTVETRAAMEELALDNVRRFLTHGELVTPVPEVLP